MQQYLENSEFIDWEHQEIILLAHELRGCTDSDIDITKRCFEYVRDKIRHTGDFKIDLITCKASDVLKNATGYCYAKSHLLAALLRANGIPAGLCYQRLSIGGYGAPYCLHGLNAVYLNDFGWYRIDPRGNKKGINAECAPPKEQLAFSPKLNQEMDIVGIFAEPLQVVTRALLNNSTYQSVNDNLPDIELYH